MRPIVMRAERWDLGHVCGLLLPAFSVVLATAVTVLPWRIPEFVAFGLPFITLGAIFHWAERRPARLPTLLVLAVGLATDLVTDGPLGYWALLFLAGLAAGGFARRIAGGEHDLAASWLAFAVALPAIVLAGWAIASLYYLSLIDARLVLFATGAGIAGYGPLAAVLRALEPGLERRGLTAGGKR